MDSDRSNDLDNLIEQIEQAEAESDRQVEILESKLKDIQELEQRMASLESALSNLEGDALQIVQQDMNEEMEQKQKEADDAKADLEKIQSDLQQQQSELQSAIEERNQALTELQQAEIDCEVDLSESKDAVTEELKDLTDTSSKVEQIVEKINGALADNQAGKKNNRLWNNFIEGGRKAAAAVTMGVSMFTGLAGQSTTQTKGVINIADNISEVRERMTPPGTDLMADLEFMAEQEEEDKRRKRKKEIEVSNNVRNKPEIIQ